MPLYFFAAVSLYLSSIEYAVPKPLPFMRLGLANLPVVFAAKRFSFPSFLLLVLLKVLLSSIISGTTFSYVFLFSMAGSFASALAVWCVWHLAAGIKHTLKTQNAPVSCLGLCLAGSLASSLAQIAVARAVVFGANARYIAPLLLASGLVTALLLGIFANIYEQKSSFMAEYMSQTDGAELAELAEPAAGSAADSATAPETDSSMPQSGRQEKRHTAAAVTATLALCAAAGAMLYCKDVRIKFVLWLALFGADIAVRKGRVKLLPTLALFATLTALALLSPSGRVLFTAGSLRITQGALEAGLAKSFALTGMVAASQCLFAVWNKRGFRSSGYSIQDQQQSKPQGRLPRIAAPFIYLGTAFSRVFSIFAMLTAASESTEPSAHKGKLSGTKRTFSLTAFIAALDSRLRAVSIAMRA